VGVGVAVFAFAPFAIWLNFLIADIAATVVVYLFSLIVNNATVYDPYWSVLPMIAVPLLMISAGNFSATNILILVCVEFWGVRLTINWITTFKDLTKQDWRYDEIKSKSGKLYPLANLFGIQIFPTLIVYGCLFPFVYGLGSTAFSWFALIGVAVMILGTLLELISDAQKHKFYDAVDENGNRKNSGICAVGLWKSSRHPNYLGEILFWWGLWGAVFAVSSELWWTAFGALANTIMFLAVSTPWAERQSAKRHGAAEWEEYKKETRLF
jgi:steroid 5-alpha reductase family enzyme